MWACLVISVQCMCVLINQLMLALMPKLGLSGVVLCSWALLMWCVGVGAPSLGVTFGLAEAFQSGLVS